MQPEVTASFEELRRGGGVRGQWAWFCLRGEIVVCGLGSRTSDEKLGCELLGASPGLGFLLARIRAGKAALPFCTISVLS